MKIIDVQEKTLFIDSRIQNAYIDFSQMTLSVVAITSNLQIHGHPAVGYGFSSNGRYSPGALLRDRFIPRLLKTPDDALIDDSGSNLDPAKIWSVVMRNEKPGGHGERSVAVGVLDMAVWDLVAKIEGVPLYSLLASRYGQSPANREVFVYAAGGYYYPGKGLGALRDEMQNYLDQGYTHVKMKIGGADLRTDLRRIEAVLDLLGPGQELCVDANGRLGRRTALAFATALNDYDLYWFEEPCDPLDYELLAEVRGLYQGSLATGENLFSWRDACNLLRYGGLNPETDWLQFDCALSYGLVEYMRILNTLAHYNWQRTRFIPHGGHQMSLNLVAGLGLGGNEAYPSLFQPFGGFSDGTRVVSGRISLPELPGIGFEGKADLIEIMQSVGTQDNSASARRSTIGDIGDRSV